MNRSEMAHQALEVFDRMVAAAPGMRPRTGQRQMAEQVAMTFSHADLARQADALSDDPVDLDTPARSIAVIQAGTGVGKSLAYSAPAVALALARQSRVLISTATVALQEQLVNKDLPALARHMPGDFRFALAKGRGRYLCQLKLDRYVRPAEADPDDDEEDDLFAGFHDSHQDKTRRLTAYQDLADAFSSGRWDGDRDTLSVAPDPLIWQSVAADVSSCTARHCPFYGSCSYFEQRKALVGAQVIVVNHDLLLSSLGSRALPELDNALLVIDEAHHLPATALDQFACQMDLSRLTWLDRLSSRALKVGAQLGVEAIADIPKHAALIRQAVQDWARLVMHEYGEGLSAPAGRVRLPRGRLPESMVLPLSQLAHSAQVYIEALRDISKTLRAEMRDQPSEARRLAAQYAQLGSLAPRMEAVYDTTQRFLQMADEGQPPVAKWFTREVVGDLLVLRAHASPTLPGSMLRGHLWSRVRGAVLTSATLTSCGRFDFLLRETGLADDPDVTTLAVESPFDFARQGRLVLAGTRADPKDVAAFTQEMVQALMADLREVKHGALVLFTSREQMRVASEALPADLRARVLLQSEWSRVRLLQQHAQRVADGLPSIIFGLQSFGEGLDLPGRLCEDLFITKLPFAPPDDPVGEARAEWLRAQGRDPFMELVVPATAIRLAQWVGRAIRTEEDEAHVTCYDRRLSQTAYGQRLLAGLPPFTRVQPSLAS